MLGNGEGKQRSKKDGSMTKRQTWQLLYLSAGEVSLKATLEQAGVPVRAGQEVRFIDLPADAGVNLGVFDTVQSFQDGNRFALAIKENAHAYYGTASKAFIKQITIDYDNVKNSLLNKIDAFTDGLSLDGTDPQVLRVARRFAIVAAAGEIASELNITVWEAGQSNWAALICFNEWLESRGGSESHEETQAIDTVRGRIIENSSARFIHDNGQPHNGAIWGTEGGDGYFVLTKAFDEHLCAGLDPKYVAKLLNEMGALSGSGGRLNKTKRINGNNERCYHILPSFFPESDQSEVDSTEIDDTIFWVAMVINNYANSETCKRLTKLHGIFNLSLISSTGIDADRAC